VDKNALHPIYGIVYMPFWKTNIFFYILIALGVVFIAFFVFFFVSRIPKNKKKSTYEVALQELSEIEKLLYEDNIFGKTFYFRLTWIFKRYLHDRYGFDVYGKTDKELLFYLESSGLSTDLVHDIQVIFEGSSFIKFAKGEVVLDRMKKDLKASKEFIHKTMVLNEKKK